MNEPNFQVGDLIKYSAVNDYCVITKIESNRLWGFWYDSPEEAENHKQKDNNVGYGQHISKSSAILIKSKTKWWKKLQ